MSSENATKKCNHVISGALMATIYDEIVIVLSYGLEIQYLIGTGSSDRR